VNVSTPIVAAQAAASPCLQAWGVSKRRNKMNLEPSITDRSYTGGATAKTAEQRRVARNQHRLLNQTQERQTTPVNTAPVSAHGKAAFRKSYERDGSNLTKDGAPAEAGKSPNGFKGGK
jgi:hypothetical protein